MRLFQSGWIRAGLATVVVAAGSVVLLSAPKTSFTPWDKAFYADPSTVSFVRPGLVIQIVSASIAADGTISVRYKLTDPKGLPLDRLGVTTPGAVTVNFLCAYIPKGQRQYVSYVTRTRSSTDNQVTVTQAAADSTGTQQTVADGEYIYTFAAKAPKDFDATATHQLGIYANRNLSEFDLGTSFGSAVYPWVPAGGTPAPRDVIRTKSCNRCHDDLAFHGGSRRGLELCIMCHTPQTSEPNSGNTVDMKVMAHKIHMGSQLPSVKAGKPYRIGGGANPADWSTVVLPSDPRRCETCHESTTGAAQADAWLKNPNRAACGACHDDVNFVTGDNHLDLPQISDNQCANCHIPQGELDLDASIRGAHVIPGESATRPGVVVEIVKVDSGGAGQKPVVTFTLRDSTGNGIPIASMATTPNRVSLVLAGPTADYGYTSFGSDVTTPGYVAENPVPSAKCDAGGTCSYAFTHAIPANAKGTFTIGIEARRAFVLLPGTKQEVSTNYCAINKVFYFSVDGSPLAKRRMVVDIAKCNSCHVALGPHGGNRNRTEHCVACHNPSNMSNGVALNFAVLVHKIHDGEDIAAQGAPYKIGNTDFSDVRYPVMTPNGRVGNVRKCYVCHINGSEANFPEGLNAVRYTQSGFDPQPATTAACTACHVDSGSIAHARTQTDDKLGESCSVCHGASAEFSVSKVHAQ